MTTSSHAAADLRPNWFNRPADDVVAEFATNADGAVRRRGGKRLAPHGPNAIAGEPPPRCGPWPGRAEDPMNIMLVVVTVVSLVIRRGRRRDRGVPGRAQRGHGDAAGAQGAGQRGRAVADDLPRRPGRARRQLALVRPSSWSRGHREARGRRHRARRRPADPLGDAGGPGGRPDRGERPDRQGRDHDRPGRDRRSATARTWCSRTRR